MPGPQSPARRPPVPPSAVPPPAESPEAAAARRVSQDPGQVTQGPGRVTQEQRRAGQESRQGRAARRAGRRKIRFWLWTVTAVLVVVAAGVGGASFLLRGGGPTHVLVIPDKLGTFVRKPRLEQQMNVGQIQRQVIAKSAGQASHVVSAVYENTTGVSGTGQPQIMLFIGGNLAGVAPAGFVSGFVSEFKGAQAARPGSMGGSASCVDATAAAPGGVALCIWADGDTFGVVASPTMDIAQLSAQLRAARPLIERPAK
jgi:hypothetical protein